VLTSYENKIESPYRLIIIDCTTWSFKRTTVISRHIFIDINRHTMMSISVFYDTLAQLDMQIYRNYNHLESGRKTFYDSPLIILSDACDDGKRQG
jgi:hypothetical protein